MAFLLSYTVPRLDLYSLYIVYGHIGTYIRIYKITIYLDNLGRTCRPAARLVFHLYGLKKKTKKKTLHIFLWHCGKQNTVSPNKPQKGFWVELSTVSPCIMFHVFQWRISLYAN